jgi:ribosomal protein L10
MLTLQEMGLLVFFADKCSEKSFTIGDLCFSFTNDDPLEVEQVIFSLVKKEILVIKNHKLEFSKKFVENNFKSFFRRDLGGVVNGVY